MENQRKRKRNEKENECKRKKKHVLRPFGRFADTLSSDSSDSDYVPDDSDHDEGNNSLDDGKMKYSSRTERKGESENNFVNELIRNRDSNRIQGANQNEKVGIDKKNISRKWKRDSSWNSITSEILVKIFQFVALEENGIQMVIRCGRICRQWNYVSKHPTLWKKVDLSFMSNYVKASDKSLIKLIHLHGETIEQLSLNKWRKVTSTGMMAISTGCPNLETLIISRCKVSSKKEKGISSESIISVIRSCKLKSIDFSWTEFSNMAKIIHVLMEECGKTLVSLNVCGCPVRSATLNSIMESCPNLRSLDISNTLIFDINLEKLQTCCKQIEELYISKSNMHCKSSGTSKADMSPCFKNLTALSCQSESLTNKVLARMVNGAANIKLLDLRSCRLLTMNALMEMEACNVERLFLARACSSFSLKDLLVKWGHSLRELDLSWIAPNSISHGLDDEALGSIAKSGIQMTKMMTLNLSGTPVCDEGVRHVVHIFPNLQSLDLTSCKGLSRGLKHEHDWRGIEQLRKWKDGSAKQR